MSSPTPRRLIAALMLAPLALGLAACSKGSDTGAASSGEKIATVAPPAGKVWADMVTKTPDGGYLMGNPQAPIKLIEYGSLTCSHCADFAAASFTELRDKFVASGRVSFEFRNFVRDAIDITAAQLTRCGAPESYFALTEQAFANQAAMFQKANAAGDVVYGAAMNQPPEKRGQALADLAGLTDFFAARGISRDQAATCLADASAAQALAKTTQEQGEKYNIQGTPTFMINGERLDSGTWPEVKARLEALGAR